MAYFKDLSAYTCCGPEKNLFNVGWLSAAHEFARGPVPSATLGSCHPTITVSPHDTGRHAALCSRPLLSARRDPSLFGYTSVTEIAYFSACERPAGMKHATLRVCECHHSNVDKDATHAIMRSL
jgi:hypothetical protein